MTATPARDADPRLRTLRERAGQVVGQAFYGTLLRTMRTSKLKGEIGHGGRGEEVFSAQLHGIYAERMGTGKGQPLVEAIYRSYARQVEGLARRDSEKGIEG
jgi:hypothetical protein